MRITPGKIKNPDTGYVGILVEVDSAPIKDLLTRLFTGCLAGQFKYFEKPGTIHVIKCKCDTAAGEIAAALGSQKLVFLTDIAGICDKSGKYCLN